MRLESRLLKLKKGPAGKEVGERLQEFGRLGRKGNRDWFSELCFCILTANSKAKTAIEIQKQAGRSGFLEYDEKKMAETIRKNRHRFHNTKARYIMEARRFRDIRKRLEGMGGFEAREWLVKNVNGIGYKEASHFLRNVGFQDLAILDRHVLRVMEREGMMGEVPKSLGRRDYLEYEKKLKGLCDAAGMSQAELDLYLWLMETGEVLK